MILCVNCHHINSTDTVRDPIRLIAACRRAMRIGMHNIEKDNLIKTQYQRKPKNTYQMIHCQRVKVTVTSYSYIILLPVSSLTYVKVT